MKSLEKVLVIGALLPLCLAFPLQPDVDIKRDLGKRQIDDPDKVFQKDPDRPGWGSNPYQTRGPSPFEFPNPYGRPLRAGVFKRQVDDADRLIRGSPEELCQERARKGLSCSYNESPSPFKWPQKRQDPDKVFQPPPYGRIFHSRPTERLKPHEASSPKSSRPLKRQVDDPDKIWNAVGPWVKEDHSPTGLQSPRRTRPDNWRDLTHRPKSARPSRVPPVLRLARRQKDDADHVISNDMRRCNSEENLKHFGCPISTKGRPSKRQMQDPDHVVTGSTRPGRQEELPDPVRLKNPKNHYGLGRRQRDDAEKYPPFE
jgi:hypothetical protein